MERSNWNSGACWFVSALALLVPTIFSRSVLDSFDLPKATILWLSIPVLLGITVPILKAQIDSQERVWHVRLSALLIASMLLSTLTSMRPMVSLFGQYQRNTGLLTWVGSVLVFMIVGSWEAEKWTGRVQAALSIAGAIIAIYAVIQLIGLDPWKWDSPGQNRPVFSTMGNVNTSSGFVAPLIPLVLITFINSRRSIARSLSAGLVVLLACSLGIFQSFQGTVAVLVGGSFLLWKALDRATLRGASLDVLLFTLIVAASYFSTSGLGVAVAVMLGLVLGGFSKIGRAHV